MMKFVSLQSCSSVAINGLRCKNIFFQVVLGVGKVLEKLANYNLQQ